jgi:hypothetical protein
MVGEENRSLQMAASKLAQGSSPEKLVAAGTIQARCAEAAVGRTRAAVAIRAQFRKRMRVSPLK